MVVGVGTGSTVNLFIPLLALMAYSTLGNFAAFCGSTMSAAFAATPTFMATRSPRATRRVAITSSVFGLVRPGDRIEVWEQDHLRHVGTVGQCAPHLRLLWILEAGTGSRRLIPVHGYRLRRSPFARPA